jgi:eukaryotic-like serine/threonine-protein kinase
VLDQSLHRFGPFIIVRTLGRGGMGEVFVARTPWDENPLGAVKRLRPDVARVPTFAERFQHEAELAVRLNHPNVVATLDVGSVEGQIYVCSELVLGKDTGLIADRLRERGQGGPAAVAIRLLLDTLSGLSYVHSAREPDGSPLMLVHRDVTPGNVLVGYDGIARLADFGLAKSLLTERSKLTNHGEILGTPHYLAPEVIRGEGASPASDLYGLGAVLYRFLTGVAPHQGTTAEVLLKVLSEQPRPLSDLRPDLPPWLVAFIHRMLETDSSRRPYDASVLLKQLTHDARASGLLVPRASVGRWLGTLFETEKADEMEERERIIAIDPRSIPDKPEGTVVLARTRAESKIAPPQMTPEELDSQGTELELSEHDVRAVVTSEQRVKHRPPVPSIEDFDLNTALPSDVTEAARRVELNFDEDSIDGMPTKAVTIYAGTAERGSMHPDPANLPRNKSVRDEDTLDPETRDGPAEDRTRMAAMIPKDDSDPTRLPGFIDDPRFAPTRASPSPLRPNNNSIAKRSDPPAPVSPPPAARPSKPSKIATPPGPVEAQQQRARGSVPPTPLAKPHGATNPPRTPPLDPNPSRPGAPSGFQRAARAADSGIARNLLVLLALLSIAIAMGIGIGVLVASLKRPQAIVLESSQTVLKDRLARLKGEMDARRTRGESVPVRPWELVGSAGMSLAEGDELTAQKSIEEIERLLAGSLTPPGGAAVATPAPEPGGT